MSSCLRDHIRAVAKSRRQGPMTKVGIASSPRPPLGIAPRNGRGICEDLRPSTALRSAQGAGLLAMTGGRQVARSTDFATAMVITLRDCFVACFDSVPRTSRDSAQHAPRNDKRTRLSNATLERIPCGCKVQTCQVSSPPQEAGPDRSGPHRKPSTQTENALGG